MREMVTKPHNRHAGARERQIIDDCGRTEQDIQPSGRTTIAFSINTMT